MPRDPVDAPPKSDNKTRGIWQWVAFSSVFALVVYVMAINWNQPRAPQSLGLCKVTEMGDTSGSTVALSCKFGDKIYQYTYTTSK